MAQKGTDLDDVSTGGGGNRARIDDKITVFKFPQKTWVTMRFFGPLFTYGGYWVKTKKKDGKTSQFYTPCPSYNPENQQRDSEIYDPWRDLEANQMDLKREERTLNFAKQGFTNAIYRKAQKQAPKKRAKLTKKEQKTGFKEKDSDSYTPVVAVRLPFGAITKLKEQAGLNVHEIKGQTKQFPVTHPKYGCDVRVYYDPAKAPADQYQISIGDPKPLTEAELAELKWDLSDLESAPDTKEVKRDFESWASRNGVKLKSKKSSKKDEDEDGDDFEDDDGDDDEDEKPSKSKKSKSKDSKKDKKKSKSKDEDEDDDLDDDDDDDSDDSDDDSDDDEDFDDDDDLDDDDEDEKPSKSKKSSKKDDKKKSKSKSKSKSKDEDEDEDDEDADDDLDDDDFGDDDEDEDEDEDEKPSKSKSKSKSKKDDKSKKKSKKDEDEDEDDDLDDDDDLDEDEDDEDDDDDLDDDEDDEEDEKPSKSKKSKSKTKSKPDVKSKKKKSKK